ncbi:hypothetical protein RJ641_015100 [Dillenia turbinata]|uniref:Uncharacterized protein n=1 Tax=Dillenia turbinata TaxID=194707 RepID=A0AAN8UX30_9MAGN
MVRQKKAIAVGSLMERVAEKLIKGDVESQIEAAKDIRRVVRSSCSSSSSSVNLELSGLKFMDMAVSVPTIAASGAAPLVVQILSSGNVQGKADAVTALYNLSTCSENSAEILDATAILSLINLLRVQEIFQLGLCSHFVGVAMVNTGNSSLERVQSQVCCDLTAEGTPRGQGRDRILLDLIRDSPKEKKLAASVLEKIAYDIAAQVCGAQRAAETA